jgi:hypothetical protein
MTVSSPSKDAHDTGALLRSLGHASTVHPKLLTAAERLQHAVCRRPEETISVIRGRVGEGVSIKEIARRTEHNRKLVRSVVRGWRSVILRARQTSLEPHLPWLEARWDASLRNGAELWRQFLLAGLVEVSALLRNGQHDEGELKRPKTGSATRPQHAPSPA